MQLGGILSRRETVGAILSGWSAGGDTGTPGSAESGLGWHWWPVAGRRADSGGTVLRSGGSVPHSTPGGVPILGAGVTGVPDVAFRWDGWILTLRSLGGILTPGRCAHAGVLHCTVSVMRSRNFVCLLGVV